MQQIVNFFLRSRNALLFLLLLVISLALTVDSHGYHKTRWVSSNNSVVGGIQEWQAGIGDYFTLRERNELLQQENTQLRQQMLHMERHEVPDLDSAAWTGNYRVTPGQIVRNTHKAPNNYAILNLGSQDGLKQDQGVIGPQGIIGLVDEVGEHYSRIITVLHSNDDVTWEAQLAGTTLFGVLSWDGRDHRIMNLADIPRLANLKEGDTVVTGQYSNVYPPGIPIGTISNVSLRDGQDYYDLQVRLFTDMARVRDAYVLEMLEKPAVDSLLQELPE